MIFALRPVSSSNSCARATIGASDASASKPVPFGLPEWVAKNRYSKEGTCLNASSKVGMDSLMRESSLMTPSFKETFQSTPTKARSGERCFRELMVRTVILLSLLFVSLRLNQPNPKILANITTGVDASLLTKEVIFGIIEII